MQFNEKYYLWSMKLLTVAQFAKLQGIPLQTIYSWIKRKQTEKHGFKVHKVGSVNLIEEVKVKGFRANVHKV